MSADDEIDEPRAASPIPGVPGAFGEVMWVSSTDYGDDPDQSRIDEIWDVDPAPLARMLAVMLGLVDGTLEKAINAVAKDDRDGPIHIVHLMAACQYGAKWNQGSLPRLGESGGDRRQQIMQEAVSGDTYAALATALIEYGFAAAAEAARAADSLHRHQVLDILLDRCLAAFTGLRIPLTEEMIEARRAPW